MKKILTEKCDGCNHQYWCQKDCVTGFIEIEDGYPRFKSRGRCINCNHCIAICPKEAIEDDFKAPVHANELLQLFAKKRSVRFYDKSKEVPKEVLAQILAAAQTAPTEKNRSTVKIYLIKKMLPEVYLKALEYMKAVVEKAGTLHPQYQMIIDLYKNRGPILWHAEYLVLTVGGPGFFVDAAIAAERMQLMAQALDVGTAYNGNMVAAMNGDDTLKDLVGISRSERIHVAFAMGIPEVKYYRPVYKEHKKVLYL